MSRSKNEISVPNVRGRRQVSNAKRRSSKRVRHAPMDTDIFTLKMIRYKEPIDRDNLPFQY